jgi:FkbM family methyltransferase
MEFGTGQAFRNQSWIERAASVLRGPLARSPLKAPLKRLYEAVLDRVPGDQLVCRFPQGEAVRLAAAFRQVTWNAEEYGAFKREVAAGGVVLDVGANLGAYTLLFGQWVGVEGRVFAFEPAPEARRGLERHVALNGLGDRIVVRPEAMSAAPGVARFRAAGPQGDNRIMPRDTRTLEEDHGGIDVATTSIDAFCRERNLRPDFIKVDVEGAELDVLKGARDAIAAAGPALGLYIEMHPHLWVAFGTSRAEIEQELERQRLRPERLDGSSDVWGIEGVCLRMRRCAS